MCVPDLHTTARLQVPFVLSTALPLLAAAALLCSYLHAELPAAATCHEKVQVHILLFGHTWHSL